MSYLALILILAGMWIILLINVIPNIAEEPVATPLFFVLLFGGWAVLWFFYEALESRRHERIAKKNLLRREKEEQENYYNQMINIGNRTLDTYGSIAKDLNLAEKYLDQAEVDFSENAFSPFWASIEKATTALARYNGQIDDIRDNFSRYTELVREYEGEPPQFTLTSEAILKLDTGKVTAKRLQSIVRAAQRNYQFASIYEQRKTNQILVAGFTTLAGALESITWQISSSIDNITSILNKVETSIEVYHKELMRESSKREFREKEALEMLDNIQRGERPPI